MSMQDPVADLLTRVRNAMMAHQDEVTIPSSKLKAAVAKVLVDEGYVADFSVQADDKQGLLTIKLRYVAGVPVIEGIQRVSKPSCRVYVGYDEIPKVRSGLGINILSTPKGVMSDKAARAAKVGGEIICAVW